MLMSLSSVIHTDASGFEITECSESEVNFTLTEPTDMHNDYIFRAACQDYNGTCVSENLSGTDYIYTYL